MTLSPSFDRFLRGMEYPATRDDLEREAVRDGLGADDRILLSALPDQSYGAAWHVRYALARRALVDALLAPEPARA